MRSDVIKHGVDAAPARSLLRADGLVDEDFDKPFIGIANSWNEVVPGHIHLNKIVEAGQGEFSIDEADTPYKKKVRVVSTITYSLKD